METNNPVIELKNVTKRFPATRHGAEVLALENLSLKVEDRRAATPGGCGEFLVLLGPSGCGKSTTLRMIAGHDSVTSGDILLDNRNITNLPAAARAPSSRSYPAWRSRRPARCWSTASP